MITIAKVLTLPWSWSDCLFWVHFILGLWLVRVAGFQSCAIDWTDFQREIWIFGRVSRVRRRHVVCVGFGEIRVLWFYFDSIGGLVVVVGWLID